MKLIIFALLFCSLNTFAQSFEPGIWKSKESLEMNGITLPEFKSEECITASQAKDAKATIEKELKRRGCSLTKWTVKNQKLDAAIGCKNEDMDAIGTLRGDFSRKSYDLKGEASGTFKQVLPAAVRLRLSGQWVKACPK
jgi:hypothetical protein